MNTCLRFSIILISLLVSVSCASRVQFRSEPSEAVVSYVIPETKETKVLGVTPLTKTSGELNDIARLDPISGEFLQLKFEKDGYHARSLLVPVNALPVSSHDVLLRLDPIKEEDKLSEVYRRLIQHLINAQTFMGQSDLSRADAEIERARKLDSQFVWTHMMAGSVAFMRADYEKSLKSYEAALEIDKGNSLAIQMIARIRDELKKKEVDKR